MAVVWTDPQKSALQRRGFVIEDGLAHQDGLAIAAPQRGKPFPQAA
jgi:hypothetical protein